MVWRFSKVAASNATADPTINYAEGMAPSAVNDSARAEMARVAQWRDDISGATVTTGTSTAYAVSSNQVFDTLAHLDGAMIAFTPHATNTGTITLNVDGLGAKALRAAPSVELPSGSLILGTPYVATYNNTDSAWYLQGGLVNPYNVPIAGFMPYAASTVPNSSFALPYGQAVSRSTYATLFTLIGSTFGAGDGSTTFNIPDLRGNYIAGVDGMGGTPSGRLTAGFLGTTPVLGATGGAQSRTLGTSNLPSASYSLTGSLATITVNSTVSDYYRTLGAANLGVPVGNPAYGFSSPGAAGQVVSTGSYTPAGTIGPLGSDAPFGVTPPTICLNYLFRII